MSGLQKIESVGIRGFTRVGYPFATSFLASRRHTSLWRLHRASWVTGLPWRICGRLSWWPHPPLQFTSPAPLFPRQRLTFVFSTPARSCVPRIQILGKIILSVYSSTYQLPSLCTYMKLMIPSKADVKENPINTGACSNENSVFSFTLHDTRRAF